MQVWNVLHTARWKYRTQKIPIWAPSHKFIGLCVSHIGSVTARHSSSWRQPNFVALNRGTTYHFQGGHHVGQGWSLGSLLPSVFWHCWLGHLIHKTRPWCDLYNMSRGMLNPAQSVPIQNQWIKKTEEAPVDTVSPENGVQVELVVWWLWWLMCFCCVNDVKKISSLCISVALLV